MRNEKWKMENDFFGGKNMNHQRPLSVLARRPRTTRPLPQTVLTSIFVFLLTAYCLLPTVSGQGTSATLSGTVQDQNGAVVPGATVRLINSATGLQRETTTNDAGYFT